MNKQLKKNRRLILIVAAMSVIPFAIAWVISKNPQWLSGSTNNGELIIPVMTTERSDLMGFDAFSSENLSELNGRWVLLNVIPGKTCNDVCIDAIYKTKQLRLMMSKDLTRIRRAVLIAEPVDPDIAVNWWQDDVRLLRVSAGKKLIEKINIISKGQVPEGMLILMDPFGNLMMQYAPGFDPYAVKADLKKLLRISQIG